MTQGAMIARILTQYSDKGSKKAQKDIQKLGDSYKSFAKSATKAFLGVFAAQKMLSYSKLAVKAFAADDKAAKILSHSLDNLGLSYANPQVKTFIADLETQFHVLDDNLRPAYQKILTSTGDWRKSQDLLKTALDLSAMSGLDVVSVAGDLSKAYVGNTKGLQKYGLGLTKTQLSAMSFEEILARIAVVSKGQAEVAADSYAGALDALNVSAANAAETIGKSLVQAFQEASGSNGVGAMQNAISSLSSGVGDAIIGATRLAKIIGFFVYNKKGTNPFTQMNEFNKANAKSDMLSRQKYGGIYATKYQNTASKAADKIAIANAKSLAALAKQTAKDKAAASAAQAKTAAAELATAKGIAALKALGIGGKIDETDPIQLEAARQNLIKQSLILRDAETQKQLNSLNTQITLNGAAEKYNDILSVIKDNKITDQEVKNLAEKWGVSAAVVRAYITQVTGIAAIDFKGFTSPGDAAATGWANALTALNAYFLAMKSGSTVVVPKMELPKSVTSSATDTGTLLSNGATLYNNGTVSNEQDRGGGFGSTPYVPSFGLGGGHSVIAGVNTNSAAPTINVNLNGYDPQGATQLIQNAVQSVLRNGGSLGGSSSRIYEV